MDERTRLNRTLLDINESYPVKVLQIGEGNFIRAFVDWMLHRCNGQGLFNGSIIVTHPRGGGDKKLKALEEQDGLYTLIVRGLDQDQEVVQNEVITSVAGTVDPFADWESFYKLAEQEELAYICSNTTEAGITYTHQPYDDSHAQATYPARLTLYLHRRYRILGADFGMTIIPCELLERAGDRLKEIVLQHTADWKLGDDFAAWIEERNIFANTLVDRIVTGYPDAEAEQLEVDLGYLDKMMVVAEPYYEWVLEDQRGLSAKLPFREAGLNVKWVEDLGPYVKRKVRILNGAHTFMVPMAYLQGFDIVRDAIQDERIYEKTNRFLNEVVAPTLPFSRDESEAYIQATMSRFRNPYIDHKLLDIALNSISKSITRLRPTLIDCVDATGRVPEPLLESYAYLFRFYRGVKKDDIWYGWRFNRGRPEMYEIRDRTEAVAAFAAAWDQYEAGGELLELVSNILSSTAIWDEPFSSLNLNIDELTAGIGQYLHNIISQEHQQ